jgi:hypothetical protein
MYQHFNLANKYGASNQLVILYPSLQVTGATGASGNCHLMGTPTLLISPWRVRQLSPLSPRPCIHMIASFVRYVISQSFLHQSSLEKKKKAKMSFKIVFPTFSQGIILKHESRGMEIVRISTLKICLDDGMNEAKSWAHTR